MTHFDSFTRSAGPHFQVVQDPPLSKHQGESFDLHQAALLGNQQKEIFKSNDLSEPNQQNLGQMLVEHTKTLHGALLLFSKDIPTYRAQDSHQL
jgi:hypothetical protein